MKTKNILLAKKKFDFIDTYLSCILEVFNDYKQINEIKLKFADKRNLTPTVTVTMLNSLHIQLKKGQAVDDLSKAYLVELSLTEASFVELVEYLTYSDEDLVSTLIKMGGSSHRLKLTKELTQKLIEQNEANKIAFCSPKEVA